MELLIYAEVDPFDLRRGDAVLDTKGGALVVDEVRQTSYGISAYGRSPGIDTGPRRRLHWNDEVPGPARLLPSPTKAHEVWSVLRAAAEPDPENDALAHLDPDRNPDAPRVKVQRGEGNQVLVLIGLGPVWVVEPELPELG